MTRWQNDKIILTRWQDDMVVNGQDERMTWQDDIFNLLSSWSLARSCTSCTSFSLGKSNISWTWSTIYFSSSHSPFVFSWLRKRKWRQFPKSDNCSSWEKAKVNLCEAEDSDMAEVVERRSRSGKKTINGDDVVMRMMALSLVMMMLGIMWLATKWAEMVSYFTPYKFPYDVNIV